MPKIIELVPLLSMVQEYISSRYAAALTDENKLPQLKTYIEKFIRDGDYEVKGFAFKELCDQLYTEMAEYSILTKYLGRENIEEININAWNDIAITYTSGRTRKLKETFYSPQHAVDIIKRLLHHSGMIIDNATPVAQGHLPNNTRITVIKSPVVDEDVGISASIRLLHPSRVNREQLIKYGNSTQKMLDFLCMCVRYGVSFVVAGATSSGKTTLLNSILTTIPDNKRVYTIETGSRELSLVRKKKNRITNNVVHTLARPSENEAYDISQEDLVALALRFNPDIICVGEMRDVEGYSAIEASMSGHTVVSTVHSFAGEQAHQRVGNLYEKSPKAKSGNGKQFAQIAFPIVVYAHKLENNDRKIMDISECEVLPNGERIYHTLFRFNVTKNEVVGGKFQTEGYFEQPEIMSESLKTRLLRFGVPYDELNKFLEKGADYQ